MPGSIYQPWLPTIYVAGIAAYYQDNLNSNLHVFLEYSNEPWNPNPTHFPQAAYFLDYAETNGIGAGLNTGLRTSMANASIAVGDFDTWVAGFTDATRLLNSWGLDTLFQEISMGVLGSDDAPNGAMPMEEEMKKYTVTLTRDERENLLKLSSKGSHKSQKVLNALTLLTCDSGEHQKERSINSEIARVLAISMKKIDRIKKRFVEEGINTALDGRKGSRIYSKTKTPVLASLGHPEKHDYEYKRCGVYNIFMPCEPLMGKRLVSVTERKTKQYWAVFLDEIATQYKYAKKITLVMDNFVTHSSGALYEAFQPKKAKLLLDRFEFVFTPKHGSWLNMAEIELNVLIGQCLNRRIDNIEVVKKEVKAWLEYRNNLKATVNWQFTREDARIKLSRLYPILEV